MDSTFLKIGITRPAIYTGHRAHTECNKIITLLHDGVIDLIHIRKPYAPKEEIVRLIEAIPAELHNRVTLHDHYELLYIYNIGGLHFNHRTPEEWLNSLYNEDGTKKHGTSIRLSKSFHTIDELSTNKLQLDYATLSPIFNSISKVGYTSTFNTKDLKEFIPRMSVPVIALGGVTEDHFKQLKSMGFSGAAMLGSIFKE